tara:strand:- start:2095 stop:3336 length:1242 start_codon:yes stop_codon:yes gene_type:complete
MKSSLVGCAALAIAVVFGSSFWSGAVEANSPQSFDAVQNPDKFAWDLFIELNHPALAGQRGVADSKRKLGDSGETVWETWANAGTEVFQNDGCKPPAWGQWQKKLRESFTSNKEPASKIDIALQRAVQRKDQKAGQFNLLFDPQEPVSETRMNRAAFEFIRDNGLYSLEGQENFHKQGRAIELPKEAREIKSAWRLLSDSEVKSGRFHTASSPDGNTYGLIALHIITKDLPQWFWSTFEHVDNSDLDIRDTSGDVRWLDRHTDGGDFSKLPAEVKGTKWQNYRLKGTQTQYVTLDGRPTVLANAIIERGFMGSSSCISCHAHATIGDRVPGTTGDNRLPIFEDIRFDYLDTTAPKTPNSKRARFIKGWMGAPDPDLFYSRDYVAKRSSVRAYTQTDFMWSFFRAVSETNCKGG